jgi:hypothetical protein
VNSIFIAHEKIYYLFLQKNVIEFVEEEKVSMKYVSRALSRGCC